MGAHRPCPDSALLAAFLDGTLDGYERTAIVSHLVECPECRAVAATVVEFREVEALDDLWERPSSPAPLEPFFTGGVTRWSREKTRAPALTLAVVAALVVLAGPIYLLVVPSRSAHEAVSHLLGVVEGARPLNARLSGAATYAPPPSDVNSPGADPARVQLITAAADIRSSYDSDYSSASRRAVGVAALLTGDLDEAIATLEIAAAGAPQDVQIGNDLAAAYYERALRANRADDLPAALDAIERVLARNPTHREALFNRALIISALQLRPEAQDAWRAYIAQDPDSQWASEARERMQALAPDPTVPTWAAVRQALETSGRSGEADLAVRHHTTAARDYLESTLLHRWLESAKKGDAIAADALVTRMRLLADAFLHRANDRLYADLVNSLPDSRTRPSATVVEAYEQYFSALRLMAQRRFVDARPVLTRAIRALSAVQSPLRLRAQIEFAATDYFALRYETAASALRQARAAAAAHRYAILQIRAAWLGGMTAYNLTDFAFTRLAYEEMLAMSAATGDIDQWVVAHVLLANLHDTMGDGARAWQHRVDASSRLSEAVSQSTRTNHILSASGDASAGEHYFAALLFHSLLLRDGAETTPSVHVQLAAQRARALFRVGQRADARRELSLARQRIADVPTRDSQQVVETDVLAAEVELLRDEDRPRAIAAAERLLTLPLLQRDHLRRARAFLLLADVLMKAGELQRAERATIDGFAALDEHRSTASAEFSIRASDPVWGLFKTAAQISLRRGDLATAFRHVDLGRLKTPQDRRAWGGQIVSLAQTQQSLREQTALIMLTQLEGELQVWVIRRHNVVTHTARITLERAVALVATQQQEMLRRAAVPQVSGELFDTVFRPVAHALSDANEVVVVADAPYNRIAFAGLWDRQRNRFVVEDHSVTLAPSATAYTTAVADGRRTPATGRRAAVFSAVAPRTAGRQPALLGSLERLYGPGRVSRHEDATPRQLVDELSTTDVLHVTASVVPNTDFPALSRIELTEEPAQKYSGALYARNLAMISSARAQLVALENANAVNADAEDSLGFARALLSAGVSNVVSPVADVKAQAVEQTWLEFHRHYAAGAAAAESLRRAQLAALDESDHRPGPWATLSVFGATQ